MSSEICILLVLWERVSMLFIHLILLIATQLGQFQQLLKTQNRYRYLLQPFLPVLIQPLPFYLEVVKGLDSV